MTQLDHLVLPAAQSTSAHIHPERYDYHIHRVHMECTSHDLKTLIRSTQTSLVVDFSELARRKLPSFHFYWTQCGWDAPGVNQLLARYPATRTIHLVWIDSNSEYLHVDDGEYRTLSPHVRLFLEDTEDPEKPTFVVDAVRWYRSEPDENFTTHTGEWLSVTSDVKPGIHADEQRTQIEHRREERRVWGRHRWDMYDLVRLSARSPRGPRMPFLTLRASFFPFFCHLAHLACAEAFSSSSAHPSSTQLHQQCPLLRALPLIQRRCGTQPQPRSTLAPLTLPNDGRRGREQDTTAIVSTRRRSSVALHGDRGLLLRPGLWGVLLFRRRPPQP